MSDGDRYQRVLSLTETVAQAEPTPTTVYIVVSRKMDSPHPYVEAVYDNETAANEHMRELRDNAFDHGVVAWEKFECPVTDEYDRDHDEQ